MLPRISFIADMMLGRLAKWLRLLGYDTLYFNKIDDSELIKIARREHRILLTRDTRLVERRPIKNKEIQCLFVKDDYFLDQLAQVLSELDLKNQSFNPYCIYCNKELQPFPKLKARGKVPRYTYATQKHFSFCLSCGKLFWEGTHWDRIQKNLVQAGVIEK